MWERCWSQARVLLHLSADEFFALTPRLFDVLITLHRQQVEHEEYLHGILCSTVVNWGMKTPKEPATPNLFMPCRAKGIPKKGRPTKADGQKISNSIREWVQGLAKRGLVVYEGGVQPNGG